MHASGVGDAGVAAVAASPPLAGLRRLALSAVNMTHVGAQALLDSPSMARLAYLEVMRNALGEPVRRQLVERFGENVCRF